MYHSKLAFITTNTVCHTPYERDEEAAGAGNHKASDFLNSPQAGDTA